MEERSFIGIGVDDEDLLKILSHNGMDLDADRYPSHVTLTTPEETSDIVKRLGSDIVYKTLRRTWDGITDITVKPTGFDTYGPLGEPDGDSHLVLLIDWQYQLRLSVACRTELGLVGKISSLPQHITVCKEWHRRPTGLVTPVGAKLGLIGIFLYSKDREGNRRQEQIL